MFLFSFFSFFNLDFIVSSLFTTISVFSSDNFLRPKTPAKTDIFLLLKIGWEFFAVINGVIFFWDLGGCILIEGILLEFLDVTMLSK